MKFNELADRIIKENIKIAKSFEDRMSQMLPNNQLPKNPIHQRAVLGQLVNELGYEKDPEQQTKGQEMLRSVFGDEAVEKALAQHAKDKAMAKGGGDVVGPTLKRPEDDQRMLSHHHNA